VESRVKYGKILFSIETISGMGFETGILNKLPVVTVAIKNKTVSTIAAISNGLKELSWLACLTMMNSRIPIPSPIALWMVKIKFPYGFPVRFSQKPEMNMMIKPAPMPANLN